MEFKTIELKESIFANNDREADRLRAELKGDKTFLLNLMSSPAAARPPPCCGRWSGCGRKCASV